ncbi:MAG: histidine--tRNA ligase [Candidatus Marinimicrobia bacterium]|nr:histidine--tRNA ligase [Candidatus Neomarinimicrobiota bacterium]
MKNITTIKGTYDLLPHETEKWREIEDFIHEYMHLHGYGEIRTPAFERTELFVRGVGEETDIVTKEMYSWTDMDKGGTGLTLKPELTAPVVRAYIQHNLGGKSPLQRLYYIDSLFRRERPQKGRQRQFNQFGIEAIGSPHPEQDAEIISMAYFFYQSLGIDSLSVKINSIGSSHIRKPYLALLTNSLTPEIHRFCNTCQTRIDKNPLRLFDCKNDSCQKLLDEFAPMIFDHISDEDKIHFESVVNLLTTMKIPYTHDKKMVRGLDYYTRTTFEVTSSALGAQDALCGGGRYDKLVETLGGNPTPAVGFAAGMERLLLTMSDSDDSDENSTVDIYIAVLFEEAIPVAMVAADEIRRTKGMSVMVETLRRSMKAQMRESNKRKAQYTIIIGEDEYRQNQALIKDMETGQQDNVPISDLSGYFSPDDHHHSDCDCCENSD